MIKPSGVPYEDLKPEDMVVVDFDDNKVEDAYELNTGKLIVDTITESTEPMLTMAREAPDERPGTEKDSRQPLRDRGQHCQYGKIDL